VNLAKVLDYNLIVSKQSVSVLLDCRESLFWDNFLEKLQYDSKKDNIVILFSEMHKTSSSPAIIYDELKKESVSVDYMWKYFTSPSKCKGLTLPDVKYLITQLKLMTPLNGGIWMKE